MSGALRPLAFLILLLVLGGCAMSFSSRSLGVPVSMAEPLAQGVAGDSFAVTAKAMHLFWGLAPARVPSLQQSLGTQLGQGGAVHNLAIRVHKSVPDVLVTLFTLGVVSPTSVTFSGVVTHGSP